MIGKMALRLLRGTLRPSTKITPAPADIDIQWNVPVPVRDGTVLRVNVFRPSGPGPFPVIMSAHPYGKDKIPAKTWSGRSPNLQARLVPQPRKMTISALTSWEAPDPAFWTRHGYAVVNADLRGGGTSDGVGALFSDAEAEDYYDLIEWVGAQDWSSGRVGLDGVSYLAISQYKVAALRPPSLTAICPWEGFSDLYRDFAYPGGVREDGFSKLWSKLTGRSARVTTALREEIVKRPERDAWYESLTPDLERIEVPMLVCASFSDHSLHTRGSFEVFRRAGSRRKKVYTHRDGKWCAYYGADAAEARLRFFDCTLKGIDNGWDDDPAVRLAITEAGPDPVAVVHETAWPPADLVWRKLRLDARSATLADQSTPVAAGSAGFDAARGVLSLRWTVPEDLDVIGPMALVLNVEVKGTDDVFLYAGVRKFRSGVETVFEGSYGFAGDMVSKGWQRAAHRELDVDLSTEAQPVHRHCKAEPLRPGEIVRVEIALRPHATRFRKGDELRLEIRGHWFFPDDPLHGQFPANYQPNSKGYCVIHTGAGNDSCLFLGTRSPVPK
ncbi:CocE/NonD family hydrolase [Acidisoma cladoniae]|jgi:predicted acyl esterase|uniref:CocE/NonD family hydrolase n=1 Tax=Acidisoma cladoniae TaxID=3040935 RepID=UPI00254A3809|nr:CocE/NonD family hydrolase [Acidisoma sp. PAMC 29798]